MKCSKWISKLMVAAVGCGVVAPERLLAAAPAGPAPLVRDIALSDGGRFIGQLVDGEGTPVADADVLVLQNELQVASTRTDSSGAFAFQGLRSGVHQVAAGNSVNVVRFWAPNTAPPSANSRIMMVSDQLVARGNRGGAVVRFLTNPWVLAGGVAAAIALPIALNNDDDSGS